MNIILFLWMKKKTRLYEISFFFFVFGFSHTQIFGNESSIMMINKDKTEKDNENLLLSNYHSILTQLLRRKNP